MNWWKLANADGDAFQQQIPQLVEELLVNHEILADVMRHGSPRPSVIARITGLPEGWAGLVAEKLRAKTVLTGQYKEYEDSVNRNYKDEFLYHVTTAKKLKSIRQQGLVPLTGTSTFGHNSFYQNHSRGKVFFCEKGGINFWREKIEAMETHNSDHPDRVIVLRVPRQVIEKSADYDLEGSNDSGDDCYSVNMAVPPSVIEVVR